MGKILAFTVTVPFLCLLLYKAVFFFEYDTKQRYLKDLVDDAAFKVRLTGVFTAREHEELVRKLSSIGIETDRGNGVIMKKGWFSDGKLVNLVEYTPGELLQRGDVFMILVISSNRSKLSVVFNGKRPPGNNDLFYRAKAFCRVEYEG